MSARESDLRARGSWPGVPHLGELLRDAVAAARAQLATTLTLVLVLATVTFAILVTTGQSAANEAHVVSQIDSAGTRLIVISDNGGAAGILPTAPAAIARLSDVSWAVGLGASADVTNPALPGALVGARAMVGEVPADVELVQGRLPRSGEAIVGVDATGALNMGPGLGRVQQVADPSAGPVGVVGVFRATGPLATLNDSVLVASDPQDVESLRYVYVLATDVTVIGRLEDTLATSAPALNPAALTIETPTGAIALRDVISGSLGAASRQLMALVMGVGAVIIGVTVLSAVVSRRRDFGRRRALGATRSALVGTLLAQVAVGVTFGTVVGTGAGLVTLAVSTGALPSWQFVAGVAGLAILLALATSTPFATFAAYRDPLRILRVP